MVHVDAADVAAPPAVPPCKPGVEARGGEGRQGRPEEDQERILVGKAIPMNLDGIGEDMSDSMEVEGEIEEQNREW